jgi:uncharacterized protein
MEAGLGDLRTVEVVLTPACNLRCRYCYQGPRPEGRMPLRVLRQAVGLLRDSRAPEVTLAFHGGEPLLAFDLLRAGVELAREARPTARVDFRLTTNGTLLDPDKAGFLARHRVGVRLSLDGVADAQDARAPGTFRRLAGLVDALRREHPGFFLGRVEVAVTLTAANLPHLSESVAFLLEKGVRVIRVSPRLTPDPEWDDRLLPELDRQMSRVLHLSLAHRRRTGLVPVSWLQRTAGEPGGDGSFRGWACGVADGRSLCVDVDGGVTGCAMLADSCQAFPEGVLSRRLRTMRICSVGDPHLARRLTGAREAARATGLFHRRERRHSRHARCRRCPSRRECGICPLAAAYIPGNRDPNLVPDLPCAFNRLAARDRARFPVLPALAALSRRAGLRASPATAP